MSAIEWIVNLGKRGKSLAFNVFYLGRVDNVYISDNHLCAAWCWSQHSFVRSKHSLLHIDRHYDTGGAYASPLEEFEELCRLNFDEYRSLGRKGSTNDDMLNECQSKAAFRWDNYLSIYHALNGMNLERVIFSTHGISDKPNFEHEHICMGELTEFVAGLPSNGNWIINLDLDFFASPDGQGYSIEKRSQLFGELKKLEARSTNAVITVALSPECCESWEFSERLLQEFVEAFGYEITLPP